jgi:uncharacterized iron-regulated membrane protein
MARTLQQLQESVARLIEQQGPDAPVAAFLFTMEDVFTWSEDGGEQVPLPVDVSSAILNEVEDCDYVYTQVFDMIDEELRNRGLVDS